MICVRHSCKHTYTLIFSYIFYYSSAWSNLTLVQFFCFICLIIRLNKHTLIDVWNLREIVRKQTWFMIIFSSSSGKYSFFHYFAVKSVFYAIFLVNVSERFKNIIKLPIRSFENEMYTISTAKKYKEYVTEINTYYLVGGVIRVHLLSNVLYGTVVTIKPYFDLACNVPIDF